MFLPLLLVLTPPVGEPNHAALGANDAPLVLRTYELSGVLPRSIPCFVDQHLFPVIATASEQGNEQWSEFETPDAEVLLDLVRRQFSEEFDAEGRRLGLSINSRLVVRAPEAVQEGVLQLVQRTEVLLGATTELFVDIVHGLPSNAPTGVIATADAEKLLATAGAERSSLRLELAPGLPRVLDLSGSREFVVDYNIEIAQAATILDPVIGFLPAGPRLQACASPAPGGSWIALVLRDTQPMGEVREVPVQGSGQITTQNAILSTSSARALQSARIAERSLALNLFLADGKALVLRAGFDLASGRDDACVVVRTSGKPVPRETKLGPVGKDPRGEIRAYPLAFALPSTVKRSSDGLLDRRDGVFPAHLYNTPLLAVEFQAMSFDELRESLDDEAHDLELHSWGPWLLAMPMDPSQPLPAGAFDGVLPTLARMAPSPRTFQVGLVLRRGGDAGTVLARATLPARAGQSGVLHLGVEESRLFDADVEVAQSASASDPVVELAFDGLTVEVTPTPGLAGDLRLDLSARAHVQRGSPREFQTGAAAVGILTQTDHDEFVLEERLLFSKDGPRSVRLGDVGNRPDALSLEVELTELR
ncbi:MAG: hypothetical protein U1F29_10445 [Planctomycetota bacterium]